MIFLKFIKRKWIYGTIQGNTLKRTDPANLKGEKKDKIITKAKDFEKSGNLKEAFNLFMMLDLKEGYISVGNKLINKALKEGNEEEAVRICGELKSWEKADEMARNVMATTERQKKIEIKRIRYFYPAWEVYPNFLFFGHMHMEQKKYLMENVMINVNVHWA